MDTDLARVFKALSDETRLKIVMLLAERQGETSCNDLRSRFTLSQPAMSHHFRVLRESRLIKTEKKGQCVYYTLEKNYLSQALTTALLSAWTGRPYRRR